MSLSRFGEMDPLFAISSTSMMSIDALELASRDRSEFRIFNIGRGEGHSLREIVSRIQKLLGQELKIVWKDARAIDLPVSIVSNRRAREVLGWLAEDRARRRIGKNHCVVARRGAR